MAKSVSTVRGGYRKVTTKTGGARMAYVKPHLRKNPKPKRK